MASDNLYIFIIGLFIATISFFVWRLTSRREGDILEQWAQRNDYRILERNHAILYFGPFFLSTNKGQSVFRIMVEDNQGTTRRGWVKCGSPMLGLLTNDVQVKWDKEKP